MLLSLHKTCKAAHGTPHEVPRMSYLTGANMARSTPACKDAKSTAVDRMPMKHTPLCATLFPSTPFLHGGSHGRWFPSFLTPVLVLRVAFYLVWVMPAGDPRGSVTCKCSARGKTNCACIESVAAMEAIVKAMGARLVEVCLEWSDGKRLQIKHIQMAMPGEVRLYACFFLWRTAAVALR